MDRDGLVEVEGSVSEVLTLERIVRHSSSELGKIIRVGDGEQAIGTAVVLKPRLGNVCGLMVSEGQTEPIFCSSGVTLIWVPGGLPLAA